MPFVSSKRKQPGYAKNAREFGPYAMYRLSCAAVRGCEQSDLHELSLGSKGGNDQAISTAFKFWNAVRSFNSLESWSEWLFKLSSTCTRRRSAIDSGRIQCPYNLLQLSLARLPVKWSRHFLLQYLSSSRW